MTNSSEVMKRSVSEVEHDVDWTGICLYVHSTTTTLPNLTNILQCSRLNSKLLITEKSQ